MGGRIWVTKEGGFNITKVLRKKGWGKPILGLGFPKQNFKNL